MAGTRTKVLTIRQGNTYPLDVRMKDEAGQVVDPAGSLFILTVAHGSTVTRWRSDDGTLTVLPLADGGWIKWRPTAAQTRALPLNTPIDFDLERRIGGEQRTILAGAILVERGVNSDD
jgi:hypothetical protein